MSAEPRIGSLVYATDQGLGILAKSFYDARVVTDVLVVVHGRRPERKEWYPEAKRISSLKGDEKVIKEFCESMDSMLFFETPFEWELIKYCKDKRVKTVLMPMYECMPALLPHEPDEFICPSVLDLDYYPVSKYGTRTQFIPIPVDDHVASRWKLRKEARVFVHNAGHGGLRGRNGTAEVLEAWKYVKSPLELIVRHQGLGNNEMKRNAEGGRMEVHYGAIPYEELWATGDVFLFPEKFNGLSLPIQEAYASGMMVMATDRYPMNSWLPREPLIRVNQYINTRVALRCNSYNEAVIHPQEIANQMDYWFGKDITAFSEMGKQWAGMNSWDQLKSRYMEVLLR